MDQHSQEHGWDNWPGWSTISASSDRSFTVWFTGLPGSGKSTLAQLVKKALQARGFKVEIIDTQTLAYWLKHELHIEDDGREDRSHAPGYDAFITYICTLLARNGIITGRVSVSSDQEARAQSREEVHRFIEGHLDWAAEDRLERQRQHGL